MLTLTNVEFDENDALNPSLYETEDYSLQCSPESLGYQIINKITLQVEYEGPQFAPTIMAMLAIQDQFNEVMADPIAVYKSRKSFVDELESELGVYVPEETLQ